MSQTIVSVRMDEGLKQEFDAICCELGLSMSTAVTILARKMAREKRLPFDVSIDPFYSSANTGALNSSIQQMKEGRTVTMTLAELDALADE